MKRLIWIMNKAYRQIHKLDILDIIGTVICSVGFVNVLIGGCAFNDENPLWVPIAFVTLGIIAIAFGSIICTWENFE